MARRLLAPAPEAMAIGTQPRMKAESAGALDMDVDAPLLTGVSYNFV